MMDKEDLLQRIATVVRDQNNYQTLQDALDEIARALDGEGYTVYYPVPGDDEG